MAKVVAVVECTLVLQILVNNTSALPLVVGERLRDLVAGVGVDGAEFDGIVVSIDGGVVRCCLVIDIIESCVS